VIELHGVSKRYGPATALAPIDLQIETGRSTVLIGPSGCGKSTLLCLIMGLVQPSSGEVRIGGERLTPANALACRRRMGYVIQDGGLFPHLTAAGNVALMARFLGWDEDRIGPRMAELAELARLPAAALDRYPVQLSGGQRQRVSLMRALMLDPEVLLLDEPLGALDPIIRSELQEDLRRAVGALEKTVVLVTHDLGEARFLGDVLVLLREGAVVQRGTLEEMMRAPADPFVTRFINAQRSPVP
jgi:osmoprotectant transport system ATP-binding protein